VILYLQKGIEEPADERGARLGGGRGHTRVQQGGPGVRVQSPWLPGPAGAPGDEGESAVCVPGQPLHTRPSHVSKHPHDCTHS